MMRIQSLASLPLCLWAFAVKAQTTPAPGQKAPIPPATRIASGNDYTGHPSDATAKPSPFKFMEPRKTWEKEPPPPRANDQQTVRDTQYA